MSKRWWRRRIAPLKRDKKPPDDEFGAFAIRGTGCVAVTAYGEIARPTTGADLVDFLLGMDRGFVWYTDAGPTGDLTRVLQESGAMAALMSLGCTLTPFTSGKQTAAVVITGPDNLSVEIVNLRVSSPGEWIDDAEDSAVSILRRAARLRVAVHQAFGTHLEMTPARTAYQAFRRRMVGGTGPRKVYYTPPRHCLRDSRTAYFGGYNLCKPGSYRKVNMYDLRSAYPSAMRDGVPIGPPTMTVNERPGVPGFVRVIGTLSPAYPAPFLIRDDDGHVQTPTLHRGKSPGQISGWITTQELDLAREWGASLTVTDGWYFYHGLGEPFGPFVDRCEDWRNGAERGSVEEAYVKLLQNSLYGRFGRKAEQEEVRISAERPEADEWGSVWMPRVDPDGPYAHEHGDQSGQWVWERKTVSQKRPGSMPHWAAWLTAAVRVRLLRAIARLLNTGAKVLYADTDCIVTTGTLPTGKRYGDWRLVSTFSTFTAYASKRYVGIDADGHETVRAAGIPAGDPAVIRETLAGVYGLGP